MERLTLVSPERRYALWIAGLGIVAAALWTVLRGPHLEQIGLLALALVALVVVRRARIEIEGEEIVDYFWPLRARRIKFVEIAQVSVGRTPGIWPGLLLMATLADQREVFFRSTTSYFIIPSRSAPEELSRQAEQINALISKW